MANVVRAERGTFFLAFRRLRPLKPHRSGGTRDGVPISPDFGRFLKNFEGMYFYRLGGVLGASSWSEIERTMTDLLAYPGTRAWWETRKHWHADEFARVDEIIAQRNEAKAYATYNLGEGPKA